LVASNCFENRRGGETLLLSGAAFPIVHELPVFGLPKVVRREKLLSPLLSELTVAAVNDTGHDQGYMRVTACKLARDAWGGVPNGNKETAASGGGQNE
jgi:hypothetical protein